MRDRLSTDLESLRIARDPSGGGFAADRSRFSWKWAIALVIIAATMAPVSSAHRVEFP